jgi:hypothetical protein
VSGYQGGKARLVNLNGSGGAFVQILATIPCRKMTAIEDYSANAGVGQGLEYQLPGDDFTQVFSIAPQTEPIVLEDQSYEGGPGSMLGNGPGFITGFGETTGTPLINLRSATATATVVRITEFP